MSSIPKADCDFLLDRSGPFLALDVGDVRIGVAASDAMAVIARPCETILRIPKKECLNRLEALTRETRAGGIVLGLPLLEDGSEGEQAEKTRAFARSLARRLPALSMVWWDERHSTGDARDWMSDRGESRASNGRGASGKSGGARGHPDSRTERSRRDEIAAAMVLREWLDERNRRLEISRTPPEER